LSLLLFNIYIQHVIWSYSGLETSPKSKLEGTVMVPVELSQAGCSSWCHNK